MVLENTAGMCESPTLCVQAPLSGNGRRMWAVLTVTGRIEVLGKETESQVEMGTEGSMRGVRGRALTLLSDESNGQRLRKRLGRRLEVPRDVVPFLVPRSVGDNDIAPRGDLSRRTGRTFPKVLGFVFRRK